MLAGAPARLTVPRNNDVIFWQSALLNNRAHSSGAWVWRNLRGMKSHQRPELRVLMLNFRL
jgi:hypothetical protein